MCLGNYSRRISSYSWVEDENNIWLAMADKNGICKIDRISGNATMMMQFPDYGIAEKDLYYCSLYKNDKVIFLPHRAKEVAVYDIKEEQMKTVSLRQHDCLFEGGYAAGYQFLDGLLYDTSVYMFGFHYPAIVKMDIDTMNLTYLTDWMAYYPYMKKSLTFLAEGHAQIGSDVYIAIRDTNMLIKLNLETDMTEICHLECFEKKIKWITTYQNTVCIFSWNDCIVEAVFWNPLGGVIKEFRIETSKHEKMSAVYWIPVLTENRIYLFSLHGDEVYDIDLTTGEYFEHKELEKIVANTERISLLQDYTVLSIKNIYGKLVIQTGRDCKWHEFDLATGEVRSYCYLIEDASYMNNYWAAKRESVIYETDMSLPYFLCGVQWV